jgi:hypothetical protein
LTTWPLAIVGHEDFVHPLPVCGVGVTTPPWLVPSILEPRYGSWTTHLPGQPHAGKLLVLQQW